MHRRRGTLLSFFLPNPIFIQIMASRAAPARLLPPDGTETARLLVRLAKQAHCCWLVASVPSVPLDGAFYICPGPHGQTTCWFAGQTLTYDVDVALVIADLLRDKASSDGTYFICVGCLFIYRGYYFYFF